MLGGIGEGKVMLGTASLPFSDLISNALFDKSLEIPTEKNMVLVFYLY